MSNPHFQIAQLLKSVCEVVPDAYAALCTTFVDANIDVIVDVIHNNIGDSKAVCYTLSACP